MKKTLLILIIIILIITALSGCSQTKITVAIPDDATNRARALLLMEDLGYITLSESNNRNVSVKDIASNPYNLVFKEFPANKLTERLDRVDYAVINSNYAIAAGISPMKDALGIETDSSEYSNIIAVKSENKNNPKTRALVAAMQSKRVKKYLTSKYDGAVISIADPLTNGYDPDLDYASLSGETITVAASPVPHAEILRTAKKILAKKNIKLKIINFSDYTEPNKVVANGKADANYFQHLPHLQRFNDENGTDLVSVSAIHIEPMGLYGGKQKNLDAMKN